MLRKVVFDFGMLILYVTLLIYQNHIEVRTCDGHAILSER